MRQDDLNALRSSFAEALAEHRAAWVRTVCKCFLLHGLFSVAGAFAYLAASSEGSKVPLELAVGVVVVCWLATAGFVMTTTPAPRRPEPEDEPLPRAQAY